MACSRGILKRINHFRRGFYPSCGNLIGNNKHDTETASQNPGSMIHMVLPHNGLSSVFRERQYGSLAGPVGFGFSSCRYMSSTPTKWSVKVNFDVKEVIPDDGTIEAVASHVPAMNEVAVAASDSAFPVAALQYLIDGVHSFTGLNWWASIVLTTVMIHGLTVPVLLHLHRAASMLKMMMQRYEKIRQEINSEAMDPEAMAEGKKRMQALFDEYGLFPFFALTRPIVEIPIFISFAFAIRNMAEKVPSFKSGGILWFTDLSIPDTDLSLPYISYAVPLLTAGTVFIAVMCLHKEAFVEDPEVKILCWIFTFFSLPVLMSFDKALFLYCLTCNLFYLGYGLVLKRPMVKRLSNIPPSVDVSLTNPSLGSPVPFSFSTAKKESVIQDNTPISSKSSSVAADRRISRSSVLNQGIRTGERQLKDGKNRK